MKNSLIISTFCLLFSFSALGQSKSEWKRVQSLDATNVYQQFINNYPNGKYTELAKQRLAELTKNAPVTKKTEPQKVQVTEPVDVKKVEVPVASPQAKNQTESTTKPKKEPLDDIYYSINERVINKGRITYNDGKSEKFKNLKLGNERISFIDSKGQNQELPTNNVFKVTKTGNYAVYGAVTTGLSALLGALQGKSEANSLGYDTSDTSGLILGLTAGGVVIGGLIGAMFKREQTVFKNNNALSYSPTFSPTFDNNLAPMLSLKITF